MDNRVENSHVCFPSNLVGLNLRIHNLSVARFKSLSDSFEQVLHHVVDLAVQVIAAELRSVLFTDALESFINEHDHV